MGRDGPSYNDRERKRDPQSPAPPLIPSRDREDKPRQRYEELRGVAPERERQRERRRSSPPYRGERRYEDEEYRDRQDRGGNSRRDNGSRGGRRGYGGGERGGPGRGSYRDNYDDRERAGSARRSPLPRDRDRRRSRSPPSRTSRPRSRSRSPRSRPRSHSRSGSARPSEKDKDADKGKPNFKNSGLLAAATNTVKLNDGTKTVLKYNEPPEARKPIGTWKLFQFKGEENLDPFTVSRQSAYLFGRDRAISDIPLDHPSCSKQHAALQFRQVHQKDEFGQSKMSVKPFIIDLESTNGTHVNKEQIPAARYYEVMSGDHSFHLCHKCEALLARILIASPSTSDILRTLNARVRPHVGGIVTAPSYARKRYVVQQSSRRTALTVPLPYIMAVS